LESVCRATYRGFESHSVRHLRTEPSRESTRRGDISVARQPQPGHRQTLRLLPSRPEVIVLPVKRPLHSLALFLFLPTAAADDPWQTSSRQIICVVTDQWDSTAGTLSRFERRSDVWQRLGDPIPVTVGKKGLGLGLGLHPTDLEGPQKREGDRRAPAGVFRLESAFGTAAMTLPDFSYSETTATDFWVDDPKSLYYNQRVNTADLSIKRDWKSAETLRRPDGIYETVIVVAHNRTPVVPGRGSAIFMHRWYGPGVATIGCTAMAKGDLMSLLRWLDASKRPVLVQAPRGLLPGLVLPDHVAASINSR
jgi:L,D-peptidoglycan transpeptidase YkuD (ErfK/YbiS/YcfS/YnhG family)